MLHRERLSLVVVSQHVGFDASKPDIYPTKLDIAVARAESALLTLMLCMMGRWWRTWKAASWTASSSGNPTTGGRGILALIKSGVQAACLLLPLDSPMMMWSSRGTMARCLLPPGIVKGFKLNLNLNPLASWSQPADAFPNNELSFLYLLAQNCFPESAGCCSRLCRVGP